jgi:hypothetical protein
VIRDLKSYRDLIAKSRSDTKNKALVKLIKLNGCAEAYRRGRMQASTPDQADNVARRIILTEEQLQSWGDKAWARELLSDRVRSRALLFVGFGNQDPIVRHHAIAVIREFGAFTDSAHPSEPRASQEKWYKLPNAPFVAGYEANLSFYQLQLLRAFRDGNDGLGNPVDKLGMVAEAYYNAFLGDDGALLSGGSACGNLPADLFLWRVAGRALCRHIPANYLKRDSAVHRHLRGALRDPKRLLLEVKRRIFEGSVVRPAPFEEWLQLRHATTAKQQSSPWATACSALLGGDPGRGAYVPFSKEPIRLPMLLALLCISAPFAEEGATRDALPPSNELPSGEELLERCKGSSGSLAGGLRLLKGTHRRRPVYVAQNLDRLWNRGKTKSEIPDACDPQNAVVILLGRGLVGAFRERRWVNTDENGEERALREVIAMGDLTVLRGLSHEPVHHPQAEENFDLVTRMPEQVLGDRAQWREYCVEE